MVVSVHDRLRPSWHLMAAWVAICAVCAMAAAAAASPASQEQRGGRRDLAADESMGGHTLARHVGRTDADLADRLRREQISAASTYTDRATAERAVGAALASSARQLAAWENRPGRRPNLVLHYTERGGQPLGRSLSRGQSRPVPAFRALVVLRWDERARRSYVLTSYPEADR
jgi:CDI toxin RNase A-like protein